jgi:hypothetical protein
MIRVYVAGSYSGDNVTKILDNMRIGMRAGTELLLEGFSPFVPWFDYHFQLMLRNGEALDVNKYYNYSIAWLEASDVLFVLPNSEKSKGTQEEIGRATDLGIPIVYDRKELKEKWLNYKREDKSVLPPNVQALYDKAIKLWGESLQIGMLLEESQELALAVTGFIRGKKDIDQIAEEIADVMIMVEQMQVLYPDLAKRVAAWRKNKLTRLEKTIEESTSERKANG